MEKIILIVNENSKKKRKLGGSLTLSLYFSDKCINPMYINAAQRVVDKAKIKTRYKSDIHRRVWCQSAVLH